jgi:hypothetical protein
MSYIDSTILNYGNYRVGENARVVDKTTGFGVDAILTLDIPANCYAEIYRFNCASGITNLVTIIWFPSGRIMVKPGCQKLLNLSTVIARMERIVESDHAAWHSGNYISVERARRWLKIFRNAALYEWSA